MKPLAASVILDYMNEVVDDFIESWQETQYAGDSSKRFDEGGLVSIRCVLEKIAKDFDNHIINRRVGYILDKIISKQVYNYR